MSRALLGLVGVFLSAVVTFILEGVMNVQCSVRSWIALAVLGLVWVLSAQPASAQQIYTWGNVGTDFSTPSNWTTNIVPGPADIGLFNGSSYAFNPAMTLSPVTVGGLWAQARARSPSPT